jgi:hypothetical protein
LQGIDMASKKTAPATTLSRHQIESLYLAGTVSVPRHFPELGRVRFERRAIRLDSRGYGTRSVIRVEVTASFHVAVARTFMVTDVAAVFVPSDPACVRFSHGRFLLGPEIEDHWDEVADDEGSVLGIVYVPELARTLTEIQMAGTAAQSIDYVPPMTMDRSVDHYALNDTYCDPVGCVGQEGSMRRMMRSTAPRFCDP